MPMQQSIGLRACTKGRGLVCWTWLVMSPWLLRFAGRQSGTAQAKPRNRYVKQKHLCAPLVAKLEGLSSTMLLIDMRYVDGIGRDRCGYCFSRTMEGATGGLSERMYKIKTNGQLGTLSKRCFGGQGADRRLEHVIRRR